MYRIGSALQDALFDCDWMPYDVFEQDVQVHSKCHTCDGPVEVEVRDGEIGRHRPEEACVLHVDLSKFDVWAGAA